MNALAHVSWGKAGAGAIKPQLMQGPLEEAPVQHLHGTRREPGVSILESVHID
eukprot:COSAG01_NODE_2027_length_8600_cov_3.986356_8_plen_53_part_00